MPFRSEAQRRYMFSQHPDIARRWASEGKAYVDTDKNKPDWDSKLGTNSSNAPVGTAGQPVNNNVTRSDAISRRMKKRQDSLKGKTN